MKRLVFCFDGTWQKLTQPCPTNVVFTAESVVPFVENGVGQAIFYDEGIGSGDNISEHVLGGMFGAGMMKALADAYRFLIFNYQKGDELFVFGFSRGAFTARSFVGLVSNCGILDQRWAGKSADLIDRYEKRDDSAQWKADMMAYRGQYSSRVTVSPEEDAWRVANVPGYTPGSAPLLTVAYLGVWETVGALGVPSWMVISGWFDQKYRFHDLNLTPLVRSARHAVAIDEQRLDYQPTLWENVDALNSSRDVASDNPKAPYQQKWFPGIHGSVGGGGDRRGLSDDALEWVWEGARAAGLIFDTSKNSRVYELSPNPLEDLNNSSQPPDWSIGSDIDRLEAREPRKGPSSIVNVSVIARRRWQAPPNLLPEKVAYRPKTLAEVTAALDELPRVEWDAVSAPGTFKVYVVQEGDTLSALAKHFYGDESQFTRLFAANAWKLEDPDHIYAGQTLRIPGIPPG